MFNFIWINDKLGTIRGKDGTEIDVYQHEVFHEREANERV